MLARMLTFAAIPLFAQTDWPTTPTRIRILLLQARTSHIKDAPDKAKFMFQPAMDTLIAMLGGYALSHKGVAFVHDSVIPDQLTSRTIALRTGDLFVWLGWLGSDRVPWSALARRGVRTVYYRTEPMQVACPPSSWLLAETWEYTFANMKACRNSKGPVVSRYIPPGAARAQSQALGDGQYSRPSAMNFTERPSLVFIGQKKLQHCRQGSSVPSSSSALLQSAQSRHGRTSTLSQWHMGRG